MEIFVGLRVLERKELLDGSDVVVGQLAKNFQAPKGMRCGGATVFGVIARSRDDSDPEYRKNILCNQWEVVVPELVFEAE